MALRISRLHCITTEVAGSSHEESAKDLCSSGAEWIQLRVKNREYTEWLQIARRVKAICDSAGCRLIINDNPVIAREVGADGVHLGKMDMDPQQARYLLGEQFIVGSTANNIDDIKRLVAARVDYIGLGPYRHTSTKKNLSPLLGLEGVRSLLEVVEKLRPKIPVIVIGGIDSGDVSDLLNVGAHGVAVTTSVASAVDKTEKIHILKQQLYQSE